MAGTSVCSMCAEGTFNYQERATMCTTCAVGSYYRNRTDGVCEPCPTGMYPSYGIDACAACTNPIPQNSVYSGNAASNSCPSACRGGYEDDGGGSCRQCMADFYSQQGGQCWMCNQPNSISITPPGSSKCVYKCSAGYVTNAAGECVLSTVDQTEPAPPSSTTAGETTSGAPTSTGGATSGAPTTTGETASAATSSTSPVVPSLFTVRFQLAVNQGSYTPAQVAQLRSVLASNLGQVELDRVEVTGDATLSVVMRGYQRAEADILEFVMVNHGANLENAVRDAGLPPVQYVPGSIVIDAEQIPTSTATSAAPSTASSAAPSTASSAAPSTATSAVSTKADSTAGRTSSAAGSSTGGARSTSARSTASSSAARTTTRAAPPPTTASPQITVRYRLAVSQSAYTPALHVQLRSAVASFLGVAADRVEVAAPAGRRLLSGYVELSVAIRAYTGAEAEALAAAVVARGVEFNDGLRVQGLPSVEYVAGSMQIGAAPPRPVATTARAPPPATAADTTEAATEAPGVIVRPPFSSARRARASGWHALACVLPAVLLNR